MRVSETEIVDLSRTGSTASVLVYSGPISIQPVTTDLRGVPTYTLEVSNDAVNYICYDDTTTEAPIDKAIQINYNGFPWRNFRLTVNFVTGSSGSVRFKVWQGE